MDGTEENFETIFKKQNIKKPLTLYSDKKNNLHTKNTNLNSRDIILNVRSQMKAIQRAERLRSDKTCDNKLNKYKRSTPLSVNMLLTYSEFSLNKGTNTHNFDTQCVSDTQLINVIEGAEVLDEQKGITQEFDTSFSHTNIEDKVNVEIYKCASKENINRNVEINAVNNILIQENVKNIELTKPEIVNEVLVNNTEDRKSDETEQTNCTKIFNKTIEIEANTNPPVIIIDNKEHPPSPIFITKTVTKKSPSPLVYSLQSFEKFEKLAIPIVEENLDIKTARILINSQIMNNELVMGDDESVLNKEPSHVHEISNSMLIVKVRDKEENIINNDITRNKDLEPSSIKNEEEMEDKVLGRNNLIFEDEILFSSDEEDNEHKDIKNLPFTCVLETSFCDQSDVLDKTMYVGFQTASNKSIQICMESFNKAKNIFDNVESDLSNREPTLTELVELLDSTKHSNINKYEELKSDTENTFNYNLQTNDLQSKDSEFKETQQLEVESQCKLNNVDFKAEIREQKVVFSPKAIFNIRNREFEDSKLIGFRTANGKSIDISKKSLLKSKTIFQDIDKDFSNISDFASQQQNKIKEQNIQGFKTASNKRIKLSEKALARCKKVFQDIDLNDFCLHNENDRNVNDVKTDCIPENELSVEKDDNFIKTSINTDFYDKRTNAENMRLEIIDLKEKDFLLDNEQDKILDTSIIREFENIDMISKDTEPNAFDFVGFQTASNKRIEISENALMKSKKVFQHVDFDEELENEEKSNETVLKATNNSVLNRNVDVPESKFVGFKTASNKEIKISEEALARTKNVLEDIDFSDFNFNKPGIHTNISQKPLIEIEKYNQPSTSTFVGFKTANNKEITISEQALAETKNIFNDIDKVNDGTDSPFHGFRTASNKQVHISEKALNQCKKIFQDIDIDNQIVDTAFQGPLQHPAFYGFKTASEKNITISNEALVKGKRFLQDLDDDLSKDTFGSSNVTFKGFQTASNKPVEISAQALARSKKIFQDISDIENVHNVDNTKEIQVNRKDFKEIQNKYENIPFQGFKTASKKQVLISEDALAKSRHIFQDSDINKEFITEGKINRDVPNKTSDLFKNIVDKTSMDKTLQIFGFKTASNRNIKVSEEALIKSRKLFADLEESKAKLSEDAAKISDSEIRSKDVDDVNVSNIINTQVLNNFDESLCTEDFCKDSTIKSKRSGSPILSCPKAKKRKHFKTPYSDSKIGGKIDSSTVIKPESMISFNDNYKKIKKYTLKDLEIYEKEFDNKSVDSYILQFNFRNILDFEFFDRRNDVTNGVMSIDNLKKHFLDTVNRKLVPEGWMDNHLKLILWKLLSYEIKFPNIMGGVCRVKNVLEQLKYRYDRELYNVERPALRKILEKDHTSTRTIILCVVSIYVDGVSVSSVKNTASNVELLLTDGWYCIKACCDKMVTQHVCNEKIVIGTKIVTHGAELLNCEQGIAPWEDISSVRLKIFGNSTRRVPWYTRLGYHNSGAILTPLSSVTPEGGRVSKLRLYVTRVYPMLYVEKFDDGSTLTRSERLEHLHQLKYENERQILLEKLYEEVEKEFSDQETQDSEDMDIGNKRRCLDSGSQIAKMMKRSRDPVEFKSTLTESQNKLLEEHSSRQREKLLQDVQTRMQEKMVKRGLNVSRNVVSLLKVRVVGAEVKSGVNVTRGMLSIWKPNEVITELIIEGSWIEVLNVVPTAVRYSEIQISAGRQSVFKKWKHKEDDAIKPYTTSMKRKCYSIRDLTKNPATATEYNEIDTAGLIFYIDPPLDQFNPTEQHFQNIYLTDADKNLLCVNFWGGIKKFGFENILEIGHIIAGMNLQKRVGNTRKSIPQYRATEFSYFTKTPKSDSAREVTEDLAKKLQSVDTRKFCEDCVVLRNNYNAIKMYGNNENVSPYRFNNSDYNISKNKMFIDSPLAQKTADDNLNLTGLDFESTFKTEQELSPRTLLRKKRVNEKIAKLKMYGEPPPLTTMYIINKSKNAANSYKSPLLSKSDISNVASVNMLPGDSPKTTIGRNDESIQSSPIIMNRTYVKRTNVNPVKLNFSNNIVGKENADDFPEDLDSSPPLSLDNVNLTN